MITLFHCAQARSFRVIWALEEMGLAYDLRMLPFPPRAASPQYLELNPLGTVPLFLEGVARLTESTAILHYLAARHGPTPLAVAPGDEAYPAYLNWIAFGEATLTFPQTLVLRYGWTEPPERRLPQIVEDYGRWFFARLRAVTATVAESETLCAGRFTMADISVGYALLLAEAIGLDGRFAPPVRAYWDRLREQAEQGVLTLRVAAGLLPARARRRGAGRDRAGRAGRAPQGVTAVP